MKQKKESSPLNKWFLRVIKIIFLIFFLFFISLGYFFYTDKNRLVLEYTHPENELFLKQGEILYGQRLRGKFIAKENNLGILAIPFETYGRNNTDLFIFRLKEENKNEWYYVREYESRLFASYPFFPFGFPIISQSKGKTYVFEFESLQGKPGNAVALRDNESFIVSKYKFSKEALLENKNDLIHFVWQKSFDIIQSLPFQRFFVNLLFYSFIIFVVIYISLFHRNKLYVDISSKKAYLKMKEINIKERSNKRLSFIFDLILTQKNILLILFIGSVVRIMILKTSNISQEIEWQFLSPFSIEQILVNLQKQWLPIFLDIGSFFLLYNIAEKEGKSGLRTGAFFFLHPLTLILSGLYSVLLNIGVFFSLGLVFLLLRKEIIFSWKKKFIVVLVVLCIFLIWIFPSYWIQGELVGLKTILFSVCLKCGESSTIIKMLYLLTVLLISLLFFILYPAKNFPRLYLILLLCFLSFTPIFLLPYIWLPIILGSLFRTKWYYFYSIIGVLSFYSKYISLLFPFSPITINYVWFVLFLWFCAEVKEEASIVSKSSNLLLKFLDKFSQKEML